MELNFQKKLELYAELSVKVGVNLQKGQLLVVRCPIVCSYFGRLVAKYGFKAGAKDVHIIWGDDDFSRIRYDNADISRYETVPEWEAKMLNDFANDGAAFLSISSTDPSIFAGINPKKPAIFRKAMERDCKDYFKKLDINECSWNIIAIPNEAWAEKVFPNESQEKALEKLWEAIFIAVRINGGNPISEWEQHHKSFKEKLDWLNSMELKEIHITTGKGTDVKIGMPENYIWGGGGATTTSGLFFFPNMPTEEIFSSPHREKINGKIVSALPLIYQGDKIDNFSLTYKDGKLVDYTAEIGYENLKALVETDEGALSLGEVALVPNKSPISDMGILFYNTLYDENASCHLAIGRGFPHCVKGGETMTKEELLEAGVNHSATHVDFMIGTADTEITGIDKDNNQVKIFINGNYINL